MPAPSPPHASTLSGDPLADRVILWTRITVPDAAAVVSGTWAVSTDPTLRKVVSSGSFTTDAGVDFTVNVDATGLQPGTTYYFRFLAQGGSSPIGRTRTAPTGAAAKRLRFAVVSCSSLAHGYFHAYRAIATQSDLDVVLHLGDYIYEYASEAYGRVRAYEPATETLSRDDYRTRYAQYRRDRDVQDLHQQHPMIAVWDDHEIADNGWKGGAENHDEAKEGAWADRQSAAKEAYFEWMPVRVQAGGQIWRAFRYGDLVDLLMLDSRYWDRDEQVKQDSGLFGDAGRSLLGADQQSWLSEQLAGSTAKWKLLGQQVLVATTPSLFAPDSWTGYGAARNVLFDAIEATPGGNVVVLTGDIHSSWVTELARDIKAYDPATGQGAVAVELVTPAVSSPGAGKGAPSAEGIVKASNAGIRYVDFANRGYLLLDIDAERIQADFFHYPDPEPEQTAVTFARAWSIPTGQTRVLEQAAPAAPLVGPALAPAVG